MEETPGKEFMSMKEVGSELGCSKDTVRRYFIAGKLDEIVWVDFLKNGKLRASRASVKAFKAKRMAETRRALAPL
jgi:hypothetical protein